MCIRDRAPLVQSHPWYKRAIILSRLAYRVYTSRETDHIAAEGLVVTAEQLVADRRDAVCTQHLGSVLVLRRVMRRHSFNFRLR